jgi:hypothetical protein
MFRRLMYCAVNTDRTIPETSGTRVDLIYCETLKFKKEIWRDAGCPCSPFLNVVDYGKKLNRAISGFGSALFISCAV